MIQLNIWVSTELVRLFVYSYNLYERDGCLGVFGMSFSLSLIIFLNIFIFKLNNDFRINSENTLTDTGNGMSNYFYSSNSNNFSNLLLSFEESNWSNPIFIYNIMTVNEFIFFETNLTILIFFIFTVLFKIEYFFLKALLWY